MKVDEPADPEFRVSAGAQSGFDAPPGSPGDRAFPRGGLPVTDARYPDTVINGVPVVATPAEVDVTTADQLRAALLQAIRTRHPVVVVDMTSTRFCDAAGLHILIAAYKRARAERSELRLVIPADGAVPRVFALTGMDRFVRCFAHMQEALAKTPCGVNPQPVPPGPDTSQSRI